MPDYSALFTGMGDFERGGVIADEYVVQPERRRPRCPEMLLVIAVMEMAVSDFVRFDGLDGIDSDTGVKKSSIHRDAEQWLFSDDRDWPFSFLNLCDIIGVEPSALRHRLHQYLDGEAEICSGRSRRIANRLFRQASDSLVDKAG